MLQETNSAQECWTERDGAPRTALTRSVFPDDALAVIYKPARSAMTSGKAQPRLEAALRASFSSFYRAADGMDRLRRHVIAGRVDIPVGSRGRRLRSAPGFALPSARCGRSRHTAGFKREGRQHEFLFARHTVVGRVALATGVGRTDARAEGHSKQVGTGTRSCRALRESPGRA